MGTGNRSQLYAVWVAVGFALVFPTAMAWVYFMALPPSGEGASSLLQTAYSAGKIVMFAYPLVCLWLFERRLPRPELPTARGLIYGLVFGLVVVAGMLLLYFAWLRELPLFVHAGGRFRRELAELGLASPWGFLLFAAFITVPHSLLEETYWRWFAFGWLERYGSFWIALALSSLGFMAHHVLLLAEYFPNEFFEAAVPFGLCTGAGGVVWAWLYHHTRSLYAPWLSHLLVDIGLFAVGYDLFFGTAV